MLDTENTTLCGRIIKTSTGYPTTVNIDDVTCQHCQRIYANGGIKRVKHYEYDSSLRFYGKCVTACGRRMAVKWITHDPEKVNCKTYIANLKAEGVLPK